LQVKLLRVIQEKEILRVGATKPRKINVRIIAATNRDLNEMAEKNLFRIDLLYRINVFPIVVPPLRERRNDILPLALSILAEFGRTRGGIKEFSPDAELALINYRWPGNIRELRNVIERAVILANGDTILPEDLAISKPAQWNILKDDDEAAPFVLKDVLEKIESAYITQTYEKFHNIRKSAAYLSMDPATYLRRLKKFSPESFNNETNVSLLKYKNFKFETMPHAAAVKAM
jgi:transcriptional regulator with PAS, ATPase and Fis domain